MRQPYEVLVVVRRGDSFLVLHRAPQYDAYWHLVAGGVEAGETALEAAERELVEEVALDARGRLVDLARVYAYPLAEETETVRARFAADVEAVTVECFSVEVDRGWEPTLNDEHDDYRWCARDEAAALLFWPEPRELLLELAAGA